MDLQVTSTVQSILLSKCGQIWRCFAETLRNNPDFVVHAPGRVNIIGEHIDYCGYGVLPMALEQGIVAAAASRMDGKVLLKNETPQKYPEHEPFAVSDLGAWRRNSVNPEWQDYVRCGLRGVLDIISETGVGITPCGLTILIGGNLPAASGVSSSSALVIASALVACAVWGVRTSRAQLAEACARSERYVGTEGGGMDQAISLLAEEGSAKFVEFNPLKTTSVQLPTGAIFVVCNSMVTMEKGATVQFNTRVVECRLACQILAKENYLDWRSLRRLRDLQDVLGKSFEEMVSLIEKHLHAEPYTRAEVSELLGVSIEELSALSLNDQTRNCDNFLLRKRATHVFQEAFRVLEFKRICGDGARGDARLPELGALMNASHVSCRDLYECSEPHLDELQVAAAKYAFGARLTGAGWGGCLVALVPKENVDQFKAAVRTEYYAKHDSLVQGRTFDELVFRTAPAHGATLVKAMSMDA